MGFVDRGRFFLKIPLGSSHATWWSLSVDKHHRLHTSRRNPGINVTETREASRIHSREGASSSRRTSCRPVARRVVPRSREASWALGPRSVSHPAGDLGSREAAKARRNEEVESWSREARRRRNSSSTWSSGDEATVQDVRWGDERPTDRERFFAAFSRPLVAPTYHSRGKRPPCRSAPPW